MRAAERFRVPLCRVDKIRPGPYTDNGTPVALCLPDL
jgi:hypothetical protein